MPFSEYLPDHQAVLSLEREELAGHLLVYLNQLPEEEMNGLSLQALFRRIGDGYPDDCRAKVEEAVMEAWKWAEREVLLAPRPTANPQSFQYYVTRRGREIPTFSDYDAIRKSGLLPQGLVHPLADHCP